ncbi:MAG: hypothetical protein ACREL7_01940 [Longimicrobiales bacterium]
MARTLGVPGLVWARFRPAPALVLATLLAVSCTEAYQPEATPYQIVGAECTPHGAAIVLRSVGAGKPGFAGGPEFAGGFGDRAREPNYNDCQRLAKLGAGGLGYGPLAFILPYSDVLDTLTRARVDAGDVLVAAIVIEAMPGSHPYPQLHMDGGLNCAYLAANGSNLTMRISAMGGTSECPVTGAPAGSPQLMVNHVPASSAEVPSTTRWEEGRVGATIQPYFGIRCPDGWCEAGPAGVVHEPPASANSADPPQRRIKGWYDRQFLMDVQAGTPVRSHVLGSIFPHEDLATYDVQKFKDGWTEVATIEMSDVLAKYQTRYGLSEGTNRLELRIDGSNQWLGRIIDPNDSMFDVRIVPGHTHTQPIAVARWGWFDDDETMWVRCADGCCQVSGPE